MYNLTHSWEDKGVHAFPKGICPKVNVIARLEYEQAYYNSSVQHFNHYTRRTPPQENKGEEELPVLKIAIIRRYDDVKKRGGILITATRNNIDNTRIKTTKINRKQKWEEKQLSGRETSEKSHEKTNRRLRKRNLKRAARNITIKTTRCIQDSIYIYIYI